LRSHNTASRDTLYLVCLKPWVQHNSIASVVMSNHHSPHTARCVLTDLQMEAAMGRREADDCPARIFRIFLVAHTQSTHLKLALQIGSRVLKRCSKVVQLLLMLRLVLASAIDCSAAADLH
jgi:hypothetical protein